MEIQINQLHVAYGQRSVIVDFSATIREGEILTLIGPNGSGKSTLLKAVSGIIPYQKGAVFYDGRELRDWKKKEISQKIAMLPQIHYAPGDFTVRELVSYGRMPHQSLFKKDSKEDREIVDWAMERTHTRIFADRYIQQLSGGELQRVWLACSLSQKPRILFLDEPTTYLDICHQIEMMELISCLRKEEGIGIVLVLHDIGQAMDISDRVMVLKQGKKYSEGKPEEVIHGKMLSEVYSVTCDLVEVEGRERPLISYEMAESGQEQAVTAPCFGYKKGRSLSCRRP